MDDDTARDDAAATGEGAFGFTGDWREFAPIAFTNLLLCIVTLGIYTFWARTRERRYLWSRTRFIDERLEWTGTGLELFIGYVLALVLFLIPFGALQLVIQGVLLRGHPGAAGLILVVSYLALLYLVGVARFRAVRYRLSRTFWRGIRGGSDRQGVAYGWKYLWRTIIGFLPLGLMIPWSMTTLWNRRWSEMSFGPLRFEANAQYGHIFLRFLLFYLAPIILMGLAVVIAIMGFGAAALSGAQIDGATGPASMIGIFAAIFVFYILYFVVLGVVALNYYAAFYREGIGTLTLGELQFAFRARTRDWIMLALGNIGLVVVTLGIGYIFVGYRNWAFFIRHLDAFGEVKVDEMTQSTTREPGQGEGLLDAFDIGAF